MSNVQRKETSRTSISVQDLPADEPLGTLEPVAYFNGAMPTGVTVSHQGRIFVNFPRWGDEVPFTVSEIRDGEAVAYPDEAINQTYPNDQAAALVSVQSVVADPSDRLWILDTGNPLFQQTKYGGPKLVCIDLTTDKVAKKILFPQDVALATTYLNDVRLDAAARACRLLPILLKRGQMESLS
jgi:sugar lactone lactonase YvrE